MTIQFILSGHFMMSFACNDIDPALTTQLYTTMVPYFCLMCTTVLYYFRKIGSDSGMEYKLDMVTNLREWNKKRNQKHGG